MVRYHTGRSKTQDMQPHIMPLGSPCFLWNDAIRIGVGASLHAQPPRMVNLANTRFGTQTLPGAVEPGAHQPAFPEQTNPTGDLLATPEDLRHVSLYDINSVNWRGVDAALRALPCHDHEEDWNDGTHFPWWVWLAANTGRLRDVLNHGIIGVKAQVAQGNKSVVVKSVNGIFYLSYGANGKTIRPTPQPYNC